MKGSLARVKGSLAGPTLARQRSRPRQEGTGDPKADSDAIVPAAARGHSTAHWHPWRPLAPRAKPLGRPRAPGHGPAVVGLRQRGPSTWRCRHGPGRPAPQARGSWGPGVGTVAQDRPRARGGAGVPLEAAARGGGAAAPGAAPLIPRGRVDDAGQASAHTVQAPSPSGSALAGSTGPAKRPSTRLPRHPSVDRSARPCRSRPGRRAAGTGHAISVSESRGPVPVPGSLSRLGTYRALVRAVVRWPPVGNSCAAKRRPQDNELRMSLELL